MAEKRDGITRRGFVAGSVAAGALAATGFRPGGGVARRDRPDLAVATGDDAAANTRAVIDALGGMGAFVSAGQVVHLLPNAQGTHPGTSTDASIVKTVVDLCKEAGAGEVRWLTWLPERFWERAGLGAAVEASGATLLHIDYADESKWRQVEISDGKAIDQIRYFNALFEGDVFINMPIIKDHIGSRFTGSLKNYMGASHPMDNRPFHPTFDPENVTHMSQCIADMNLVSGAPDLIVADCMTILTENGPMGPGAITEPKKVIAGVDRVAVDAYGAGLLSLDPSQVEMITMAAEHGLGENDLGKLNIAQL